jgi:Fur family ferric uptake transcriptional regulator
VTDSPRIEPLSFDALDDVLVALRAGGHRVSTPCRLVLESLFEAEGPISARFIAAGGPGQGPPLELASVYRNLERLETLGVVRHIHLGHAPGLYMLVGGGEKEVLACVRCGRATIVDRADLDPIRCQISKHFGYEADFSHFAIAGLCERCAGDTSGAGGPGAHRHQHEHSHGDFIHSHPHEHVEGVAHGHSH